MAPQERPPNRRVGTALYQYLQSLAERPEGARPGAQDQTDEALAYAQTQGYAIERHRFEASLDLGSFDHDRFAGEVERVKTGGIRFFNLAQEGGEAVERRLYLLRTRTERDIPGYDRAVAPAFEVWRKRTLEDPARRADCIIVAAAGDRLTGFIEMLPMAGGNAFYVVCTAVDREFRRRGIARALMLLAVQTARRYGARRIWTHNDSQNEPMLAMTRSLGFVPLPGLYVRSI